MKIKLTKEMKENWEKGICPFCQSDNIEDNADEKDIENGYEYYCYGCNSPLKVTDTHAINDQIDHYQYN